MLFCLPLVAFGWVTCWQAAVNDGCKQQYFYWWLYPGWPYFRRPRPVLPVEKFLKTFVKLSIKKDVEGHPLPNLPQLYADRFGWQEMTRKVAQVYHSLLKPTESRLAFLPVIMAKPERLNIMEQSIIYHCRR